MTDKKVDKVQLTEIHKENLEILENKLQMALSRTPKDIDDMTTDMSIKLITVDFGNDIQSVIVYVLVRRIDEGSFEYALTGDVSNCSVTQVEDFVNELSISIHSSRDIDGDRDIWLKSLEEHIPGLGMYSMNRLAYTVLSN